MSEDQVEPGRETEAGRRRQLPQVQQAKIISRKPYHRDEEPQQGVWKTEAQRFRKGASEELAYYHRAGSLSGEQVFSTSRLTRPREKDD